jgi:hypothetical protein
MNSKKSMPGHIILKILQTYDKTILKERRHKEMHIGYRGTPILKAEDFYSGTVKASRK